MLVTRETDYAIRILRNLSTCGKAPVSKICESESIPNQFAYKILKKLEKADLVESFRGVNGGYRMTRDACDLTLFDVLYAMDSKFLVIQCIDDEFFCANRKKDGHVCHVNAEMQRLQGLFETEMKSKSLQVLFEGHA